MLFNKALAASLLAATVTAKPILQRQTGGPIKGVNIGGWLVLEPWITPSIFQTQSGVVDEYTLTQNVPNAESILQSHWASWATEGDFQKIAGAGLNLVRIPVGYWAFQKYDNDPYIQGAAEYLDKAIGWAADAGLNVWVDLHGAPLSQNGFDNSGQKTNSPGWTSGDTISFTTDVIGQVAERYGNRSNVVGIELLNEPLMDVLPGGRGANQQYNQQGYDAVRGAGYGGSVVFSDGFAEPSSWNGFLSGQNTIVDHHEYQVFTDELLKLDWQGHVDYAYSNVGNWAGGADKPVVNGEWTAAMTDCAPALNGYGIGARYDGTFSRPTYNGGYESSEYIGSCASVNFIDQWTQDLKTATTNFIRAQIDVSENQAAGWIFWNFKTEASAEWDFFRLLDNGVWPSS